MNVFQLGRMRRLDLLALWFRLCPGSWHYEMDVSKLSGDAIANLIIEARQPYT